jgi:hypothetical protein
MLDNLPDIRDALLRLARLEPDVMSARITQDGTELVLEHEDDGLTFVSVIPATFRALLNWRDLRE